MPAGRPSKYKPEMCDRVIELGREGMSKVEIAAELDIHYSTFIAWQEEKPEFSASVKQAEKFSQAWWERKGREATFDSQGFNATSYIFNMKNRFSDDWRDKVETDINARLAVSGVEVTFVEPDAKAQDG